MEALKYQAGQFYIIDFGKSRMAVVLRDVKYYPESTMVKFNEEWHTVSDFERRNPVLQDDANQLTEVSYTPLDWDIVLIDHRGERVETIIERITSEFVSHTLGIDTLRKFNQLHPELIGYRCKFLWFCYRQYY